ncbi:MAG: tetratricopeptide repeat protein [Gracilimonas sp.]|nr:tetratricopeptide repeat protein [Gracilimonas sp.]
MDNSREIELRNKIDAYIKGSLSENEIQDLWNTFAKEPELLDILELEVNVKAAIEEEAQKQVNSSAATIQKLPTWTWHAAAAAVIAVIALVQLFRIQTPTDMNQFLVQQIKPSQVEMADGIRAAKDMNITTADSLLNLGFEAIISGNDSRALELFDIVIEKYSQEPYGSKAYLNKGIVLYNDGDYESAVSAFRETLKRVEDSNMITEKAYWYLGNALVNLGQLEQAQEAVFNTYQMDGIFRNPAFRLLKKLSDDLGTTDYEEFNSTQLD